MAKEARVYTTAEVCEMFKIGRNRITSLVKSGRLVRVMHGRYTVESVEALMEGEQAWREQLAAAKARGYRKPKPVQPKPVQPKPTSRKQLRVDLVAADKGRTQKKRRRQSLIELYGRDILK